MFRLSEADPKGMTSPETPDREIVLEVLGGNVARFQALVERYSPWCHAFFRRRFPQDPDGAQDLTQESFLRAFKYLRTFDPRSSFRGWLRTICDNLARDSFHRARQEREKTMMAVQTQAAAVRPAPSPRAQALEDALEVLPDRQRETIELKYFWKFTIAEIAAALGVSPGTVKNDLGLARRRLMELMEDKPKP